VSEEAVAKVARAELIKRVLIMVTAVMVAAILVLLLVLLGRVRGTQVDNTQKADERDATLLAIQDCTQPSGECYKRGQKRTAAAVGDIGAANILTVVCALNVPNGTPLQEALDQVTQCVADRLSRQH
jgi:hypothetical protein